MFFREIIFPKRMVVNKSRIISSILDYWKVVIDGSPYVWVKCPICFHNFKLLNVLREDILDQYMRDNIFYYRELAIEHCPKSMEHICLSSKK